LGRGHITFVKLILHDNKRNFCSILNEIEDAFYACLYVLTVDGSEGGPKRGNTPMIKKECYEAREARSREEKSCWKKPIQEL
jgi:hypothetical protein